MERRGVFVVKRGSVMMTWESAPFLEFLSFLVFFSVLRVEQCASF